MHTRNGFYVTVTCHYVTEWPTSWEH